MSGIAFTDLLNQKPESAPEHWCKTKETAKDSFRGNLLQVQANLPKQQALTKVVHRELINSDS